jgi:hypothetical protein
MNDKEMMKMNFTSKLLTILLLALAIGLPIQVASAYGGHYELDKPYYHPGDTGKLLLSLQNDGDESIFGVEMDIQGIGVFKWNMTGLPKDRMIEFGPNNTLGYLWKKGEPLNIEICFRIPADMQPGEYAYKWTVLWGHKTPFSFGDTLKVYALGVEPPPQPPNPLLLVLIALPILLITYPVVRWKSRKAAKVVAIGIIALIASGIVLGGFLFIILVFNFVTAFYPLLILLILAIVIVSVIRRRRGEKRVAKARKPLMCSRCGRGLSTLPRDITICPYCGEKLPQRTCSACGKDLSQLPTDIKNCPYCGKTVLPNVEAPPVSAVKVTELPAGIRKIRRYATTTALLGLLIALSSLILGPFLGGLMGSEHTYMFPVLHAYQNAIGNWIIIGILLAIISAIVRAVAGIFKRKG